MFLNPLLITLSRWLWRHNIKPTENVVGIKKYINETYTYLLEYIAYMKLHL